MANQMPLHKRWFLFTKPLQVEVVCLSNEMVSISNQLWLLCEETTAAVVRGHVC